MDITSESERLSNGDIRMTLTAHVPDAMALLDRTVDEMMRANPDASTDQIMAALFGGSGSDVGDTSKGLHLVVYQDGNFNIMRYHAAAEEAATVPDYVCMIPISTLRAAINQALN